MPKTHTKPAATDWERVKREAAQEAPIAHAEDDVPYDPNDAAAAAAYWQQASIKRGRGRSAVAVKRPTLNMRVDAMCSKPSRPRGRVDKRGSMPPCAKPWPRG
jgi:hypothetical protein